jgi:hypothetical protein
MRTSVPQSPTLCFKRPIYRSLELVDFIHAHLANRLDPAFLNLPEAEKTSDVAVLVKRDRANDALIADGEGLAFQIPEMPGFVALNYLNLCWENNA